MRKTVLIEQVFFPDYYLGMLNWCWLEKGVVGLTPNVIAFSKRSNLKIRCLKSLVVLS
jgi:hypothetical protein